MLKSEIKKVWPKPEAKAAKKPNVNKLILRKIKFDKPSGFYDLIINNQLGKGEDMSTVKLNDSFEDPITQEVFNDIKKTRSTDYIGNLWKYLSFNPVLLKDIWQEVKSTMSKETLIDKKTKELIYMAVSITNNCSYCIHSHTAAARKLGLTQEEHAEFLRIVSLAAKTNQLLNGMQLPVDQSFNEDAWTTLIKK